MTTPQWPASLPEYPLRNSLSIQAVDNVIRAPTDLGPANQRPRATAELFTVECQVKLGTRAQLNTLMDFHRDTLGMGALRFNWNGLAGNIAGDYQDFQFSQKPRYRPAGATAWLIDMQITALPGPLLVET